MSQAARRPAGEQKDRAVYPSRQSNLERFRLAGELRRWRDLGRGEIARHDDLHELHIVGPVVEVVDDTRALMHTVASLVQSIDTVIVEFCPAAQHVDDVDLGG